MLKQAPKQNWLNSIFCQKAGGRIAAHKKKCYCLQEKFLNSLEIKHLAPQENFLRNNVNNLLFLRNSLKMSALAINKQSKQ